METSATDDEWTTQTTVQEFLSGATEADIHAGENQPAPVSRIVRPRQNPSLVPQRDQPLISGIPGAVVWILLVIVLPAFFVPFASSPTVHVPRSKPPAQVEVRIGTRGLDKKGRQLPFVIYVLSQQFSWKLESTADLEGSGTLLSPELKNAVNNASEVFCVGTASFEGAIRAEEDRAAQRAVTLAEWIRPAVVDKKRTRLFSLNAGQYVGPKELQSAFQRKAIIIASGHHEDGVDLGEALESGLVQKQATYPFIYDLLHHYSRSNQWLRTLKAE